MFQTVLSGVQEHPSDRLRMTDAPARLQAKLASVLWRTARREQARQAFRDALRTADRADVLLRAHLHTRLGRLEMADHDFDAALGSLRRGRSAAR